MAKTIGNVVLAVAGALVGAALAKELDKPPGERTWHGEVGGVPYDFRPPTLEKIRRTLWDPDNPELFPPHLFGVGWSVNVARLVALASRASGRPPASGASAGSGASDSSGGSDVTRA